MEALKKNKFKSIFFLSCRWVKMNPNFKMYCFVIQIWINFYSLTLWREETFKLGSSLIHEIKKISLRIYFNSLCTTLNSLKSWQKRMSATGVLLCYIQLGGGNSSSSSSVSSLHYTAAISHSCHRLHSVSFYWKKCLLNVN